MQFVSTWQLAFFKAEIHKLILKFTWKYEKLRTAKTILGEKESKTGELTLSNFKTYYKV